MNLLKQKKERIEVIDALRGLALVMICMIHNQLHFLVPSGEITSSPFPLYWLDKYFLSITYIFAANKGYAIFSILFGFTFSLQYRNCLKKGIDFGYRFLWRMFLLGGFALLNSLLYPGDILLTYAIFGILLFLTRSFSDKAILLLTIILLLQPLEWLYLISSTMGDWAAHLKDVSISKWREIIMILIDGNFISIVKHNLFALQEYRIESLLVTPRSTQSAGLLLLGAWLQRKEVFITSTQNNKFWIYTLICCALLISSTTYKTGFNRIDTIISLWHTLFFTLIMISSFVLLYQNVKFKKIVSPLNIYGKMAMTNYITQGFLGAFIYYPVGLNLGIKCSATTSFFIGILMVIIQISFCRWWLKTHKQGPLEGLWHKLTWLPKRENNLQGKTQEV